MLVVCAVEPCGYGMGSARSTWRARRRRAQTRPAQALAPRTMRLEFSEPPSQKRLAFSMQAPETRSGHLQTHCIAGGAHQSIGVSVRERVQGVAAALPRTFFAPAVPVAQSTSARRPALYLG
jgi:hypothetical protein